MKKIFGFALVIVGLVLFVWSNTYTVLSYVEEQGLIMPSLDSEKFIDRETRELETIDLVEMNFHDTVYEKHGKYYLNDDKENIDLDYPLIIRKERAIRFTQPGSYIISDEFESVSALQDMVISGQNSFNSDGSQADLDTFILAQLKNGIFMTLTPIYIESGLESFDLPQHTLVYFNEEFINAYLYNEGGYDYQAIRGLQNTTITINKQKYTYDDFLKKINVVKDEIIQQREEEEKKQEEIKEKYEKQQKDKEQKQKKDLQSLQKDQTGNLVNNPSNDEQLGSEIENPKDDPKDQDNDNPKDNSSNTNDNNQNNNENSGGTGGSDSIGENGNTGGDSEGIGGENGGGTDGEKPVNPDTGDGEDGEDEEPSDEPSEPGEPTDPVYPKYVKPTVNVGELKAWTYSIHTNVEIYDPSSRLVRGVKFDVIDVSTGKVLLRKQFRQSSDVNLSIVSPDSSLVVSGSFQYYNEEAKKITETFLTDKYIETLPIENHVAPVKVSYQLGTIQPQKLSLEHFKIENTTDYDPFDTSLDNFYKNTLPYISKAIITLTDDKNMNTDIVISGENMNQLITGKEIQYTSSNILKSATHYTYTMVLLDKFGNQIPLSQKISGTYQTAKTIPTLLSKITTNMPGEFTFQINLTDNDHAITDPYYKLIIVDEYNQQLSLDYILDGNSLSGTEIEFESMILEKEITVTNLPFSQQLYLKAYTSYNIDDGLGEKKNQEIGSTRFYSAAMASGSLNYTNSFTNINGTYLTLNFELNQKSTSSIVDLMTNFHVTLLSDDNKEYVYKFDKDQFNAIDVEKNYDEENKCLIIQEENKETKEPLMTLEAPKSLFIGDRSVSVWQAFLNGAYNGTGNGTGAKLHITLSENTLSPSTKYKVSLKSEANQGGIIYDLQTLISKDNFTTKKREPQVSYDDYFMAQDFIELYDVYVSDTDATIINGNFNMQVIENGNVIDSTPYITNKNIEKIRIDNVQKDNQYIIRFIAPAYNDGQTVSSQIKNYTFKEYKYTGGSGIQANITLNDMQYVYRDKLMNSGNLDQDTLLLNKYLDYNTNTIIDKEGYFLTDFIKISDENGNRNIIFKDFGPGDTLPIYLYRQDKSIISKNNIQSNLYGISKNLLGNVYGDSACYYIRICGRIGYETKAKVIHVDSDGDMERFFDFSDPQANYIENTALDGNGNPMFSWNNCTTDYLEVNSGEIYELPNRPNGTKMFLYASDKRIITSRENMYLFEIPANIKYIRIQTDKSKSLKVRKYVKSELTKDFTGTISWELSDQTGFIHDQDKYAVTRYQTDDFKRYQYQQDETLSYQVHLNDVEKLNIKEIKKESFVRDRAYKYEISYQYHGRNVILDSCEFDTRSRVMTIKNAVDLYLINLNSNGQFIVVNDIYENSKILNGYSFYGSLDFQGHTYFVHPSNHFGKISKGSVIKNVKIVMETSLPNNQYFLTDNYGTLDNIVLSFGNDTFGLDATFPFMSANRPTGVISNFIIEFNGIYSSTGSVFMNDNFGIIKNGYIYNTVKNGHIYLRNQGGILTYHNYPASTTENIYAVIDLYTAYNDNLQNGTIKNTAIISSIHEGIAKNIFAVSNRYGFNIQDDKPYDLGPEVSIDPLFGTGSTKVDKSNSYQNIYLNSIYTYEKKFSDSFDNRLLWDYQWYDKNIGQSKAFQVQNPVSQGYYPRLKMTDTMNKYQPYISLPEVYEGVEPELLDAIVTLQREDYANVTLKFKNPGNAVITKIVGEDITCQMLEQTTVGEFYEVKIRVSDPKYFFSSYNITQVYYRTKIGELTFMTRQDFPAEFYSPIKSFNDWSRMKNSPNQNYRLKTDLDFSTVSNWGSVTIGTFTGKLDGGIYDEEGHLTGRHVLKNINLDNYTNLNNQDWALIGNINYASISHLDIEGFIWHKQNPSYGQMGLFGNITRSIIDDVHINDANVQSFNRSGTLAAFSSKSYITNSSVTKVNMKGIKGNSNYYFGGLLGYSNADRISNCFVSSLKMELDDGPQDSTQLSAGGLIGRSDNSTIESCYVIGKIKNRQNNGGISGRGTAYVSNCYTDVLIEAEADGNGGLIGNMAVAKVTSNLVIGNLLNMKTELTNTHRISGESLGLNNQNYAYEKQTLNNQSMGQDDVDGLLSLDQLKDPDTYIFTIKLGDQFDYSVVSKSQLPLLKSTTGDILPYQSENFLQSDKLSFEVTDTGISGQDYTTQIVVKHKGFNVSQIDIGGMDIQDKQVISSEEGLTTYNIRSSKQKALDIYTIKVTFIDQNNLNHSEELTSIIDFKGAVYWEINNVIQWQSIMASHADGNENFKIVGEIDFSGIDDPILAINANRFEGVSTDISVIKNIGTESSPFIDANYPNIIKSVTSELSQIQFKDIFIQYNKNTQYLGLVGINSGNINHLVFENCHIKSTTNSSTALGMIGKSYKEISNIDASHIYIDLSQNIGGNSIGGIIGNTERAYSYLTIKNSQILAQSHSYVGGAVGYCNGISGNLAMNSYGENLRIEGNSEVGGLTGWFNTIGGYNMTIKDSDIIGITNTGGVIGRGSLNNQQMTEQYTADNVNVYGRDSVGGVIGFSSGHQYSLKIKDSNINASRSRAGGITGTGTFIYTDCQVVNCKIKALYASGGISGNAGSFVDCFVIKSIINAERYVGGVTGLLAWLDINNLQPTSTYASCRNSGVRDCEIIATDSHAGGISGASYSDGAIENSFVKDSHITSKGYTGGLVGEVEVSGLARNSYISGGSVIGTGEYTGGLFGKVVFQGNTSIRLNTSFCDADIVKGKEYTGGLFGYLSGTRLFPQVREFYGLFNLSPVESDMASHGAHALGWMDSDKSFFTSRGKIFALDKVLVNGSAVDKTTLDDDYMDIFTVEDLLDSSIWNGTIASGGLSMNNSVFMQGLTGRFKAQSFTLIQTKSSPHSFKLYNIDLPDGEYKAVITYYNNNVVMGKYPLQIKEGCADLETKLTQGDCNLKIYDATESQLYCQSVFRGLNTNKVFTDMKVTKLDGTEIEEYYYESDTNEILTMTLPEGNYKWYRSTTTTGYTSSIEVTSFANGNVLKTNAPGFYYAIDVDNNVRTRLFQYQTNGFVPVLSISTTPLTFTPFQNDYQVTDSGVMSIGPDGLIFKSRPIGKPGKVPMVNEYASASFMSLNKDISMPTWDVYASGIDSINIEFSEQVGYINQNNLTLRIFVGGQSYEYKVNSRVMTIGYHFNEELKIEVVNGDEVQSKTYKPIDLQSTIGTYHNNQCYKTNDGVKSSSNNLSGDFVNVYQNLALKRDGSAYNLDTARTVDIVNEGEHIKTRSLYQSTYDGVDIQSFYRSSVIGNRDLKPIAMLSHKNNIYAVDGNLERLSPTLVVDNYQDNKYLVVLSKEGQLVNLMDDIIISDDFKNQRIAEISYDEQGTHQMLVRYDSGDLVELNYLTGEVVELEGLKKNLSLLDYMQMSLSDFFGQFENHSISYAYKDIRNKEDQLSSLDDSEVRKIEELVNKETKSSSQNDSNQLVKQTARTYTSVYNSKTQQYETYLTDDLIYKSSEELKNIDEKLEIAKENGYELKQSLSYKKQTSDEVKRGSIALFVGGIISGIMVLLGLLKFKNRVH